MIINPSFPMSSAPSLHRGAVSCARLSDGIRPPRSSAGASTASAFAPRRLWVASSQRRPRRVPRGSDHAVVIRHGSSMVIPPVHTRNSPVLNETKWDRFGVLDREFHIISPQSIGTMLRGCLLCLGGDGIKMEKIWYGHPCFMPWEIMRILMITVET